MWNTDADELTMKMSKYIAEKKEELTKRKVVSYNHQIFDPLVWWAPRYVGANLRCCKIAREVNDWDEPVPFRTRKRMEYCNTQFDGH